ncbi:MAG: hypothetical protein HKN60_03060 [Rhizobiales bacterium]|nr:hypothetical protein [Hyphomicrobiales bacterium]
MRDLLADVATQWFTRRHDMLFRMAFFLLAGHLIVAELVPSATDMSSEINWWSYVIRRDIGLDRIEQAFREIGRR